MTYYDPPQFYYHHQPYYEPPTPPVGYPTPATPLEYYPPYQPELITPLTRVESDNSFGSSSKSLPPPKPPIPSIKNKLFSKSNFITCCEHCLKYFHPISLYKRVEYF